MQFAKKITVLKSHEDAHDILEGMTTSYNHHIEGATVVQGVHPTHGEIVLHLAFIGECYMVSG